MVCRQDVSTDIWWAAGFLVMRITPENDTQSLVVPNFLTVFA